MPLMSCGGIDAAAMAMQFSATPARPASLKTAETVLAFDFGSKRIGVAVGESTLGIAHPLEVIAVEDNRRRFERIAALIEEWRPARLVVGFPAGAGEGARPLADAIARFERRLRARFGLPVERVDEALSSWDASRRLSASGVSARAQKTRLDAFAACVILQTWFERCRAQAHGGAQ